MNKDIKAGDYLSPKNSWEDVMAYIVIVIADDKIQALAIPKNGKSLASIDSLSCSDNYEVMADAQKIAVRWELEATIMNAQNQITSITHIKEQINALEIMLVESSFQKIGDANSAKQEALSSCPWDKNSVKPVTL